MDTTGSMRIVLNLNLFTVGQASLCHQNPHCLLQVGMLTPLHSSLLHIFCMLVVQSCKLHLTHQIRQFPQTMATASNLLARINFFHPFREDVDIVVATIEAAGEAPLPAGNGHSPAFKMRDKPLLKMQKDNAGIGAVALTTWYVSLYIYQADKCNWSISPACSSDKDDQLPLIEVRQQVVPAASIFATTVGIRRKHVTCK